MEELLASECGKSFLWKVSGEISGITLIQLTLIAQVDFFISLHNLRINAAVSPQPGNKH